MTRFRSALAFAIIAAVSAGGSAREAADSAAAPLGQALSPNQVRTRELDAIFSAPALARAELAVRVESLTTGNLIYARRDEKLVVPASNMKILTVAAAARRLGWDFRYETTLEATGTTDDGVLAGDLIVRSTGDPSIGSLDAGDAPLFLAWADALNAAGIRRVTGRLIGDDNAFDDEPYGAGWSWDYLSAGYAAPSGALSYNENVAVVRITPAATAGASASVSVSPPGHTFEVKAAVTTERTGTPPSIEIIRLPGSKVLTVRGRVAAGGPAIVRTAAIENPTRYFVDALRSALDRRGIAIAGGAWDIDDLPEPPAARRRLIASHRSEPLSVLAGYAMKMSQNFYGETFLKTLGVSPGTAGSYERGREAVRAVLAEWGVEPDAAVIFDGSGLARNNYTTARAIVTVLRAVWRDEVLRGPFVASLPVGGRDGTLQTRMRNSDLDRRVQAKTGTINNVRALSGYLETTAGEKLAFSMIANHYSVPAAEVDAIMERALTEMLKF